MIRLFSTMMICLALAACGGGGGGGGGDDSTPSSTSPGSGGETAPGASRPGLGAEPPPPPPLPPPSEGASNEAASVDLSWTPPTARENGEPLPMSEIHSYEIYFYADGSDDEDGEIIRVEDGSRTSYTVEVPGPGTYHFAMVAVDTNGLPSDTSNHVSVTVD